LSHNTHDEIRLKIEDYEGLSKQFIRKCASGVASLSIKYADDFPELNSPDNYGYEFEVDFTSLTPDKRFIEVIPEYQWFLFSELCFNFVKAYRIELKSKT
jgi:hypothetical protein